MNEPSEPVGPWLRHEREAAGLTQEELADRSGLSVRAISDLERGRSRRPYPRSVRMVVKALGLPDAVADEVVTRMRTVPAAPVEALVVPRQLPAAAAHFVGRQAELKALDELLEQADDEEWMDGSAVVISAIEGTAGIGKTALGLRWAHQAAGWFRDGQLYVNLRGFDPSASPLAVATVVRRFLDAFAVSPERIPADLDAQLDLYRSLVAGKRMLIVLDNARDAEQVRPLLPGASACLVLITSRNRLADLVAVEGAVPLTVGLFSTGEARELLARRVGAEPAIRESAAVTEIVELCGRLPLALNIAASWAATHPGTPLAHFASELRDAHERLDLLSAGHGAANLRAVFSWSYDTLTGPAARMFRLLGVHPGPDFGITAAASLAGVGLGAARRAVGELMAVHLLNETTAGRFGLHDLLRTYAAEQADLDDERAAAITRMLDHYLHTARDATRLLFPARDPIDVCSPAPGTVTSPVVDGRHALAWFDAEHAVLLAVSVLAADAGFDRHAWQIPTCMAPYLERRGHWHDYATSQRVALEAAARTGDLPGQGSAHCLLARAHGRLGAYPVADDHLQRALALYRGLDDRTGQAHTHHSLGWVLGQQGCYREALQHAHKALALYIAAGHRTGEARTLNTVGWYGSLLGLHDQALVYCRQALELHRALGNHDGEADAWDSLGHANQHLGRYAEAVDCYQHAQDLFDALGDQHQQADTLTRMGDAYLAGGDFVSAREAWGQALVMLKDLGHPDAERLVGKLAPLSGSKRGPVSGAEAGHDEAAEADQRERHTGR